jgi:hypothetical protein
MKMKYALEFKPANLKFEPAKQMKRMSIFEYKQGSQ